MTCLIIFNIIWAINCMYKEEVKSLFVVKGKITTHFNQYLFFNNSSYQSINMLDFLIQGYTNCSIIHQNKIILLQCFLLILLISRDLSVPLVLVFLLFPSSQYTRLKFDMVLRCH